MEIVWHRGDLRVHDNPALSAATSSGETFGLVILDPNILNHTSDRRKAWFFANVKSLRKEYNQRGGKLVVANGSPAEVLPTFAKTHNARVHATKSYTPYGVKRDSQVEQRKNINWYPGTYVHEPGTIIKPSGDNYSVFTPFEKRWWATPFEKVIPPPERIQSPNIGEGDIHDFISDVPLPDSGEQAALIHLNSFLKNQIDDYSTNRNKLDSSGVSKLSYYFNMGVLSPRLAVNQAIRNNSESARKWISEIAWRDFMADILFHSPNMLSDAYDKKWNNMQWQPDNNLFDAWKNGETGIPVVDACMRELNQTGWMSNRGRMIVAQCLTKLMLLPWQWGEAYFKQQLLDGDTAQNVGGWQWSAGLGIDAAPYFRVFNPVTQAQTHDPNGEFIRKWVPESDGSPELLPNAILNLKQARERYLNAASQV